MQEKYCLQMVSCNGGCGGGAIPHGSMKYAQFELIDEQSIVTDKKIYFPNAMFGNLELTEKGTVVLEPGVYLFSLNFQLCIASRYMTLMYYDLISNKPVGIPCSRISADHPTQISCSSGTGIVKIDKKVELCVCVNYIANASDAHIEDLRGSIIQLSD